MQVVMTSLLVIVVGVLINIWGVPRLLWLTTGVGNATRLGFDGRDDSSSNVVLSFVAMFAILVGWAFGCFYVADVLAGEDFGNRWVLLFCAAALAGSPYSLFQRRSKISIAWRLAPPLQSAMEFAGGVQSLVVMAGMLSGIFYDWWPHLPG